MAERWNHNIHHHPVVLGAVPPACRRALDVGCGEGGLTRELARLVPEVVGIDRDRASIELARMHPEAGSTRYLCDDVLTSTALEAAAFDLVASIATLHHMDASTGLRRMAGLVRPGGVLVVVGLARSGVGDLPRDALAVVVSRALRLHRGHWEHPSPKVWPPPLTYGAVRALAERELPGVTFRRHLLFRYSLTWSRPPA